MKKRYKHVSVDTILRQLNLANKLLASSIPQSLKSTICTEIENLLMDTHAYCGFNHNYWMKKGSKLWRAAGEPQDFPEKTPFIIGEMGFQNRKNDDFVSDIEGEFSRHYFQSSSVIPIDSNYLRVR